MDSSVMWDMYALACIVVDCDMPVGDYNKLVEARGLLPTIKRYLEHKDTCKNIFSFVDKVMLSYDGIHDPTYNELEEIIKSMRFKQYK